MFYLQTSVVYIVVLFISNSNAASVYDHISIESKSSIGDASKYSSDNIINLILSTCESIECALNECMLIFKEKPFYKACADSIISSMNHKSRDVSVVDSTKLKPIMFEDDTITPVNNEKIDKNNVLHETITPSSIKIATLAVDSQVNLKMTNLKKTNPSGFFKTWSNYICGSIAVFTLAIKVWLCVKFRKVIHSKLCCNGCSCCRRKKNKTYSAVLKHDTVELESVYA